MAGETLQFSTSAIRSYTGPTGAVGNPLTGTGGTAGPTGAQGQQGSQGGRGSTGLMLKRTQWNEDTKLHDLVFGPAGDDSNDLVVGITGLTGGAGYIVGSVPSFYNAGSNAYYAVVTGATSGTIVGPGSHPYWTDGISGSTLSFRKLGVSGDLVFYTDESKKIGTGPTYDIIGISGPVASNQYGTVTGQSVGELIYLTDRKNVKDAHGLTFNQDMTLAASGFSAGGLTWGTIRPKFYSATNHFHVHGNVTQGVTDPNFTISNNQSSVHVIYAPFFLKGITYDKHPEKKPISFAPPWDAEKFGISGATANYGEATTATLIIKNGPLGVNFSENFYFPPNANQLGKGINIVNCLTYDEGVSWLCNIAGNQFGYTGEEEQPEEITLGSCCDNTAGSPTYGDCSEYQSSKECADLGSSYTWHEQLSCQDSPCGEIFNSLGSCCINRDPTTGDAYCLDQVTEEDCTIFGGIFRNNIPCGPSYPCGSPCDDDFGDIGACCKFDENGNFQFCEEITQDECNEYGSEEGEGYGIYAGDYTYCNAIDCCQFSERVGACCTGIGTCSDSVSAEECANIGGIWQGADTECASITCSCETDEPPEPPIECDDPNQYGICCFGCNPVGCANNCTCQECLDAGGVFHGPGSCSSFECEVGVEEGACCYD